MEYDFQIIEKDWYKRRQPNRKLPQPLLVEIPDLVLEKNAFCRMLIHFDNGKSKKIIGRVIYNPLNNTWSVDGMEVAVRVVMKQ